MKKLFKKINSYVPNFISRNFGRKVLAIVMALFVFWKVSLNWDFFKHKEKEKSTFYELNLVPQNEGKTIPISILLPPDFKYKVQMSKDNVIVPFSDSDIFDPELKAFIDLSKDSNPGDYYKNVIFLIDGREIVSNYKILAKIIK